MSMRYGWTPREIGRLTLAQVRAYSHEPAAGPETVRMPLGEALALLSERQAQRRRWIEGQVRGEG